MTVSSSTGATISPELDQTLAASRSRPLPASPGERGGPGSEPEHARQQSWRWARAREAHAPAAPPSWPATVAGEEAPWWDLGVTGLLAAMAEGSLTPSALLASTTERLLDPALAPEAVLRLVGGAEEAAAESDARWRSGTARPLEGIPFGVKDIIDIAGTPVTCGSLQTGDRVAAQDAAVVARLRAAGAVPVAMLATTEFACGDPANARYGAVRNPWDRERWTGGSSTGSGAALAARMLPLALGTDTGGSIRIPSALCGVSGLKPTYGLVPRTGVAPLAWTLDHVGPMARDVADLALALAVMAGADGLDPAMPPQVPLAFPEPSLRGMRIGVPRPWFQDRVDTAVLAAYEDALGVMAEQGATVVPLELEGVDLIHDESWLVFYSELASQQEENAARPELFDAGTRARLACGFVPSGADYLRSLRRRGAAQRLFHEAMDAAGVDVLVVPGPGAVAPRLDDLLMHVDGEPFNMHRVIPRNSRVFDYTGMPALMVPAGTSGGLPVGLQVVGRLWDDGRVLAAGHAFQRATAHHRAVPPRHPS